MSSFPKEIGGYFGLELPFFGDPFPTMVKYQSARGALRAVLEHVKPSRLLLPAYICDAVVQAVVDAGVQPEFYYIDEQLFPKNLSNYGEGNLLLYVNYFGLNDYNVSKLLDLWPKDKLIIDNSQALFSKPTEAIATIYSPRKFLGMPDGGLLFAPFLSMVEPEEEDKDSVMRMRHLLIRAAYSARDGYADYLIAEKTLEKTLPLAMSQLTRRILSSIDLKIIKQKRRHNFQILSNALCKYNMINFNLLNESVPLCYPLFNFEFQLGKIKNHLISNNIYIPTYWHEVKNRVDGDAINIKLVDNCLPIPCDHRYSLMEMRSLSDIILTLLEA